MIIFDTNIFKKNEKPPTKKQEGKESVESIEELLTTLEERYRWKKMWLQGKKSKRNQNILLCTFLLAGINFSQIKDNTLQF